MLSRTVLPVNNPEPLPHRNDLCGRCQQPQPRPLVSLLPKVGLICLVGLLVAVPPASAQQQLQVWPGLRDTNGPSIDIETEDNVRCRFTHGARPSFSVAGLSSNPNNNVDVTVGNGNTTNGFSSQLGGGVLLTIPLGGIPVDGCERLVSLQEQRSRLALAASLLEQGLITQEQFQQLGASIARKLGITGPGPSGGPSARPMYVAPPERIAPLVKAAAPLSSASRR